MDTSHKIKNRKQEAKEMKRKRTAFTKKDKVIRKNDMIIDLSLKKIKLDPELQTSTAPATPSSSSNNTSTEHLQIKVDNLIMKVEKKDREIEALTEELKRKTVEDEALLEQKDGENKVLREKLEEIGMENDTLETTLQERDRENRGLVEIIGQMDAENKVLQEKLEKRDEDNETLEVKLEQSHGENNNLEEKLKQMDAEIGILLEKLKQRGLENKNLKGKLEHRDVENKNLKGKLAKRDGETGVLQMELEQKHAENKFLNEKLEKMDAANRVLHDKLEYRDVENKNLQETLKQSNGENWIWKKNLEQMVLKLDQSKVENKILEESVKQRDVGQLVLELKLQQRGTENNVLLEKLNTVITSNRATVKSQIMEMKERLVETDWKIDNVQMDDGIKNENLNIVSSKNENSESFPSDEKVLSHFPPVLQIFVQHQGREGDMINWRKLLPVLKGCRFICKSWKQYVDFFLQNDPSHVNLCGNRYKLMYYKRNCTPHPVSFFSGDQLPDWKNYSAGNLEKFWEYQQSTNPNYNPVPTRHILIDHFDRYAWMDEKDSQNILNFLQNFGKQIWYLSVSVAILEPMDLLSVKTIDNWLCEMLHLLPNIRSLSMYMSYHETPIRSLFDVPRTKTLEQVLFPRLKYLRTFQCTGGILQYDHILSSNRHIQRNFFNECSDDDHY